MSQMDSGKWGEDRMGEEGMYAHMGTDFFPEGGKNDSKFEVHTKMGLGEG